MQKKSQRELKKSDNTPASRKHKGSTRKNNLHPSVEDVDKAIRAQNAPWFVNKKLNKQEIAPHYSLGLDPKHMLSIKDPPRVKFNEIFKIPPNNPQMLNRLVYDGFISKENAKKFGFGKISGSTFHMRESSGNVKAVRKRSSKSVKSQSKRSAAK
jgi:hypothetical protein